MAELRSRMDEDGNHLVSFPDQFDEVVDLMGPEQLFSALPWAQAILGSRADLDKEKAKLSEAEKVHRAMARVMELDRVLMAKTKEAQSLAKKYREEAEELRKTLPPEEELDRFGRRKITSVDPAAKKRSAQDQGLPPLPGSRQQLQQQQQRELEQEQQRRHHEHQMLINDQFSRYLPLLRADDVKRVNALLGEDDDDGDADATAGGDDAEGRYMSTSPGSAIRPPREVNDFEPSAAEKERLAEIERRLMEIVPKEV